MQLTDEQIERLRQSGIRLDTDGRFWHEGAEVTHAGLRAALWRWLDRNPDGRWVLRLDERRFVYLDVDDLPFVVRSLRWEGARAVARLSDDSEEPLDASSVRLREDGGASAIVKRRFPARLSTAAWNALSARIVERDGHAWLDAEGGPFRLDSSDDDFTVNPGPFVVSHPCPRCDGRRETEAKEPCAACHATGVGRFFHGTKADLKPGDLIEPGRTANFGDASRVANHVYFAGTLDAATWGAELARGEGRGRIYIVEPTGPVEDDPNLTDKKFPGNPTRSYRSREPLRVTGEIAKWRGHSPEQVRAMKEGLAALSSKGAAIIDD